MRKNSLNRRQFMHIGAGAFAVGATAKFTLLQPHLLSAAARPVAPSDTIRFASIGTGVRGCELLEATLAVPGVECVAVCDLYDSRHDAGREAVKKNVPGTRNYREILYCKDVDAVIIAVTDHQHRRIFEDACAAGKDVYCEKPMSHTVEDGFAMVEAAHKNSRMVQIGSQRVSSILYAKAKEIYDSGKLGEVTFIDAYWDRNSPSGAWVYPIPPDASEKTIDWNTFLGTLRNAPSIRSASSAGAASPTTARAWQETSSFTSSPASTSSPAPRPWRSAPNLAVGSSTLKTAANSPT